MSAAFRAPTRVTIEPGCSVLLGEAVRTLGARRALLVSDPGVRDLAERAARSLAQAGVAVETFDAVESNPRTTTAEAIAGAARAAAAEAVVALGGGSPIDAAKAGAMLATNRGKALDFVGRNRFAHAPLPLVAVPTTCGTGSEVTWVAVLSDVAARTKVSVKGDGMFPAVALVDPDLLATLPPALVATTGMDALTHAIEATTVSCRNPVSDALAEAAIARIGRFLERCVAAPATDAAARRALAEAATLAGLAFGNADVGAVHCLSESIGGRFDLPHGLLNAALLPAVLESHRPVVDARLAALERRTAEGGQGDAAELAARFVDRVATLAASVGIPRFATLGVPPEDFDAIAAAAVANGSNGSNPRPMDRAAYLAILRAAG